MSSRVIVVPDVPAPVGVDLSDLPDLAAAVVALAVTVRAARARDSAKGRKLDIEERRAVLHALGAVCAAAWACVRF